MDKSTMLYLKEKVLTLREYKEKDEQTIRELKEKGIKVKSMRSAITETFHDDEGNEYSIVLFLPPTEEE